MQRPGASYDASGACFLGVLSKPPWGFPWGMIGRNWPDLATRSRAHPDPRMPSQLGDAFTFRRCATAPTRGSLRCGGARKN